MIGDESGLQDVYHQGAPFFSCKEKLSLSPLFPSRLRFVKESAGVFLFLLPLSLVLLIAHDVDIERSRSFSPSIVRFSRMFFFSSPPPLEDR